MKKFQNLVKISKLDKIDKELILFTLQNYTIIFLGIAVGGIVFERYLETIILLVSYFYLRYVYPKTFHHSNAYWCIFWSIVAFWLSIPVTPKLSISLFGAIIVGCVLDMVLYYIADYIDLLDTRNKTIEQMTDDEFVYFCKSKHLSNEEINYATLILRDKLKGETLYSAMGYSMAQAKRIKKKIINKLKL